jgi:hypothetical protein
VEPVNYTTTNVSTNNLDLTALNHLLKCALTTALDTDMPRVDMMPSKQWRATGEQRYMGRARYSLQLAEESSPHREAVSREAFSL